MANNITILWAGILKEIIDYKWGWDHGETNYVHKTTYNELNVTLRALFNDDIPPEIKLNNTDNVYFVASPDKESIERMYKIIDQLEIKKSTIKGAEGATAATGAGEIQTGSLKFSDRILVLPFDRKDNARKDNPLIDYNDFFEQSQPKLKSQDIVVDWSMIDFPENGNEFQDDKLEFLVWFVMNHMTNPTIINDTILKLIQDYKKHAIACVYNNDANIMQFIKKSFSDQNGMWFNTREGKRRSVFAIAYILKYIVSNTKSSSPEKWTSLSSRDTFAGKSFYDWVHELWRVERRSTLYWLNIFGGSVIIPDDYPKKEEQPILVKSKVQLTGVWKDKQTTQRNLKLSSPRLEDYTGDHTSVIIKGSNIQEKTDARFVLATGPSASGKTKMAEMLTGFKAMVNADGARLTRELSIVYQTLIYYIQLQQKFKGYSNLVGTAKGVDETTTFLLKKGETSSGFGLYDSDKVKHLFVEYLEDKEVDKFFQIYMPETLSSNDSQKLVEHFRSVSGADPANCIQMMVYQHATAEDCPYKNTKYACVGCSASGKNRQVKQGKKYSSGGYERSVKNSMDMLIIAEDQKYGQKLFIHNAGKLGKTSIIVPITGTIPTFNKNFQHVKYDKDARTFIRKIIDPYDHKPQQYIAIPLTQDQKTNITSNIRAIQEKGEKQEEETFFISGAMLVLNMAIIGFSLLHAVSVNR